MTQKDSGSKPKLRRAKSLLAAKEPAKKKATKKTTAAKPKAAAKKTTATKKTTASKAKTTTPRAKKTNDTLDQKIAALAFELSQRRIQGYGLDRYDWELASEIIQLEAKLKSKKAKKFDPSDDKIRQRIEQKAYELFARKGYVHGTEDYDWYVAEQLIRLES